MGKHNERPTEGGVALARVEDRGQWMEMFKEHMQS